MSYAYNFIQGKEGHPVVFAFHGTGGDEHQMVPFSTRVAPDSHLITPRGDVLENGTALRFFRRFGEGVLDVEDLKFRAGELANWFPEPLEKHGLDGLPKYGIGYSNGASILGGITLLYPGSFSKVVLLRPMVPFEPDSMPDLSGISALILASEEDDITPIAGARRLVEILRAAGAAVEFHVVPGGHALTQADVDAAKSFLEMP